MSQDFDKYEKQGAYHWSWYSDPNWAWYKEAVDRCVEFVDGPTLDVGCGDGVLTSQIARYYPVFGMDNDPTAIKLARKNAGIFKLHDITQPIEGKWEYMVCLNVIEHLDDPLVIKRIFNRNITKAGIIITDKPTGNVGRYHEHEYTKGELLETFKEFKPKYFEINSTEHGKPITFHGVEIYK